MKPETFSEFWAKQNYLPDGSMNDFRIMYEAGQQSMIKAGIRVECADDPHENSIWAWPDNYTHPSDCIATLIVDQP